jgi:hypothetical protein
MCFGFIGSQLIDRLDGDLGRFGAHEEEEPVESRGLWADAAEEPRRLDVHEELTVEKRSEPGHGACRPPPRPDPPQGSLRTEEQLDRAQTCPIRAADERLVLGQLPQAPAPDPDRLRDAMDAASVGRDVHPLVALVTGCAGSMSTKS